MANRLTQQYVDLLARGAGSARVTNLSVDVLASDITPAYARVTRLSVDILFPVNEQVIEVSNEFNFVETADHNYYVLGVNNTLNFEAATGIDYEETIRQYLNWTPRYVVDCANRVFTANGETGQVLGDVYEDVISNVFTWTEEMYETYNATNSLGFSVTVIGLLLHDVANLLEWDVAVDSSGTEFERDDTAQHCLKQNLSYTIQGETCREKEYAPIVGEGDNLGFPEMVTVAPTLSHDRLEFRYPADTPTLFLELKNPKLGNSIAFSRSGINRQTRGGDQILVADPKWATSEVQTFEIENLCDIGSLVTFLNASLGKEVVMVDWEGRLWRGVILTPETQLVNQGRNRWSLSLVFLGSLD